MGGLQPPREVDALRCEVLAVLVGAGGCQLREIDVDLLQQPPRPLCLDEAPEVFDQASQAQRLGVQRAEVRRLIRKHAIPGRLNPRNDRCDRSAQLMGDVRGGVSPCPFGSLER